MSKRENVVLIGFMGTGKSSIGRNLAHKLHWRFADTDQLVVERTEREISAIFAREGEEFFREQERRALDSLLGDAHQVIATGGGIVLRPENRALLREECFTVWLVASEEVIFERISRNDKRPLLQTENPRATIAQLLAARQPLYESAAHFKIDTSEQMHGEIANQIISEARRFFCAKNEE